jgi:hypothetical protein
MEGKIDYRTPFHVVFFSVRASGTAFQHTLPQKYPWLYPTMQEKYNQHYHVVVVANNYVPSVT